VGDFATAFKYNPVGIILGPIVIFWSVLEIRHWLLGRKGSCVKFKPYQVILICAFVASWFTIRNIPLDEFNWARPTPETFFDSFSKEKEK